MTAAQGWFPDPAGGPDRYRWWDGAAWTRHLSDDIGAPPPPARAGGEPANSPGPSEQAETPAVATLTAEQDQQLQNFAPPTGRPATRSYPPGYDGPRRAPRHGADRGPTRMIVVGVIVVVLATVIGVVITVRQNQQFAVAPPTGAPSSPPPAVEYDDITREAVAGGLTVTLPGDPYVIQERDVAGVVLENGVSAYTEVHTDYDGQGSSWVVDLSVGFVPDDYQGSDLVETARKVFAGYLKQAYGGAEVRTTKRKASSDDQYFHPVRIVTADVHYSVRGVPSTYDDLSLLVVDNEDGSYSALIAARPNKLSEQAQQGVDATFESIQITG